MNNKPLLAVTLALSTLTAMPASAEDTHPGRSLHDRNCQSCHDSKVYTREKRMVNDSDALRAQVTRCENNLGLQWFDDQKDSVVRYLNDSYYHF
jgi:cytochrome c5